MLRARFQRQGACVTVPIGGPSGDPIYLDHLEFTGITLPLGGSLFEAGPSTTVDVPLAGGGSVQIQRQLVVHNRNCVIGTVKRSALEAAVNGTPAVDSAPLPLQFAIGVEHVDIWVWDPIQARKNRVIFDMMTVEYHGLGPISDADLAPFGTTRIELDTKLRQQIGRVTTPLDLASAMTGMGGGPLHSVWSGLAMSSDGSRVEIRVEFATNRDDGVADSGAWSQFHGGSVDDIVDGQDWAMLLDKEVLLTAVAATITSAIAGSTDFRLEAGPVYSWEPSLPGVVVNFGGEMIDACDCFWHTLDLDVDVSAQIAFIPEQGLLRTDLHLDHDSNDAELACCELSAAAVAGFFAATIGVPLFGPKVLVLPAAVFIYAIVKASTTPTLTKPPGGMTKDPNDDEHFWSDQDVATALGTPDDIFRLTATRGYPGGLAIAGTHQDRELVQGMVSGSIVPFGWREPAFDCSSVKGQFEAHAEVVLSKASGDLEPVFCGAQLSPPDYQAASTITYDYAPYAAHVNIDLTNPVAAPARVLAFTQGGVRLFEVAPAPALSKEQADQFRLDVQKWRLETCFTLEDPWFKYFHRFNPKWLIDPAPRISRVDRRWQPAFAGLQPGDRIAFTEAGGQEIYSAFADDLGRASGEFSADLDGLDMVRQPAAGREPGEDLNAPSFTLRQLLLEEVAVLRVDGQLLATQGFSTSAGSELLVATTTGGYRIRIDEHGRTVFHGSASRPLSGAITVGGSLFGWTAAGLLIDLGLATDLGQPPSADEDLLADVRTAIAAGSQQVGLLAGRVVAILDGVASTVESGGLRRLELDGTVVGLARNALLVEREGSFATYQLPRDGPPLLVGMSTRRAALMGTRAGRWLATGSAEAGELVIETVVAERSI